MEIRAQFPVNLLSIDAFSLSPSLNKEVLTAQQHVRTLSRLVNEIPLEVKINTEDYMRLKTSVKNT
ncbi:hypothetical protein Clacol_002644 [Clathrus columnatus]|uniref:Uncharacterized protein n=1 Tax=Clathrus columnatus TaxID=1419009 RepID=A0AAV5A710_9AGAM|nr:hypothetical protein Clacol_002644 [Clathrus columnatus]